MTIQDLYNMRCEDNEFNNLQYIIQHSYHGAAIAPELQHMNIRWECNKIVVKAHRLQHFKIVVTAHRLQHFDFGDGRRTKSIYSLSYMDKPFMVVAMGGRDIEKDWCDIAVTDKALRDLALEYLLGLVDYNFSREVTEVSVDTEFGYGF